MFEVGFSELCMIALVALLVIGPERLPKFARLAGFWIGKTRNMVANVKSEIHAELQAEEMRQLLKSQSGLDELQQLQDEFSHTIHSVKLSSEVLEDSSKQSNPDE
ncbi:MAG: Sec-independent protein translocase protein TatB [Methylovulum sp.]|uniref:Sec-independent protein translocase protein TatB n=1 Tax=Methylovulum sp. TaxID=1916980 RepID=UPI0026265FF5|nr:Sec-independent protein translocase protein TatB [Methylovulum sp.]MDD2723500.1 Sec-independent protein translocase protein TatB [Methylovulum sp.]MDD5124542.1 Sec-independent protein translocase protein TatB [Methylovulum sp.]